ncbi:hypothetical protein [Arthrobacter sp.]|uniref:hypothetical protein n=1 Tax=Arthrobacter sp. TaxID=1667 RepID=UPI003390D5D8
MRSQRGAGRLRAPDAEWVLMYRLGLSRARTAAVVRVPPASIGYHLAIARRRDPGLEAERQAAAGTAPAPGPSPTDLARMDEVIASVSAQGRLPEERSAHRSEWSKARWLYLRRREAAAGNSTPPTARASPGWPARKGNPGEGIFQGLRPIDPDVMQNDPPTVRENLRRRAARARLGSSGGH